MSRDVEPENWHGTRVPTRNSACGFCRDKHHERCAHEIPWFDKLWVCNCDCNSKWEPKNVVVLKKQKERNE